MTVEQFEEILRKIYQYTSIIYLHVKGEPLLHPQLKEMMDLADKYGLKVNLTTNGTLFPELAKMLGTCPALNKIYFSLHSENKIPNYCEKIFDHIKDLSPKTTVIYRLWTLKDNQLDESSTRIVNKMIHYYNLSKEIVKKIKLEKNIKIKSTIYVDKDNQFEWPEISDYKSNGYCHALKTQIAILVDGTVVPCCLDADAKIPLGNIFDNELEMIINSEKYQKLKKSFQDRKPTEKLCQSCKYKECHRKRIML